VFRKFIGNHILANLAFVLVLVMGTFSYLSLPRQQNPTINFNWVQIFTILPGASAGDVETRITDVIEDAIANVHDVQFISSTSRQNASSILIRFRSIDSDNFDKRLNDLRREVQNILVDLPAAAMVLLVSEAYDDHFTQQVHTISREMRNLDGIEDIGHFGLQQSQLHVLFDSERLESIGVPPSTLANTVSAYFRDLTIGSAKLGDQNWLIRLQGTDSDPGYLSSLPILSPYGEIPLRSVANIKIGFENASQVVRYQNKPATLLIVNKTADSNILDLTDSLKEFIAQRNEFSQSTGVSMVLLDDQTEVTRTAIRVMENNALYGLILVFFVTWMFLGLKLSLLTVIGIPFILAGTFWALDLLGQTLNTVVLLGIVIALGMLVDDAVVVVEAIYVRLRKGQPPIDATVDGLKEVAAPVVTSVLTTVAVFLCLILLPGILGSYLRVAPIVVVTALTVSLVEAFWMLPSHITHIKFNLKRPGKTQQIRQRCTQKLQNFYTRYLLRALRHPKWVISLPILLLVASVAAISTGIVQFDFFATDLARQFFLNIELATGSSLEQSSKKLQEIEALLREEIQPHELREIGTVAGLMLTDNGPYFADHTGQLIVSLTPGKASHRDVEVIIENMRKKIDTLPGIINYAFIRMKMGPPVSKPVSVKVSTNDFKTLRQAADQVIALLKEIQGIKDISDDDIKGVAELTLTLDHDAIVRTGVNPAVVIRDLRLMGDGETVASMRRNGIDFDVVIKAEPDTLNGIDHFLRKAISLPEGQSVSLSRLVKHSIEEGKGNIRHYNQVRTITIEADIDNKATNTVRVQQQLIKEWNSRYASQYPNVKLDFSGEADDVYEAMNNIIILMLFGVCLIYAILGTQFKSYIQPLIIITSVPVAFSGVVFGLILSNNPMSLYTLYGVVALAGIAVNSAIVLISTANEKIAAGLPPLTAIILASKRRVIPILITSMTTVAGLFSLAVGLGGKSLIWGPVATSIVWGLGLSTLVTLFLIPVLYLWVGVPETRQSAGDVRIQTPSTSGVRAVLARIGARWRILKQTTQNQATDAHADDLSSESEAYLTLGADALSRNHYPHAIKAFEHAIKLNPDHEVPLLKAAQSIILYLETFGWDEGYAIRARRYLKRAEKSGSDHEGIEHLTQILERLENEANSS
jgi:multidrug efflux pump subunit AcrB